MLAHQAAPGKPRFRLHQQIMQHNAVPKVMQQDSIKICRESQQQPQAPSHDCPRRHLQRHADDLQGTERPAAESGREAGRERRPDGVRGGGGRRCV